MEAAERSKAALGMVAVIVCLLAGCGSSAGRPSSSGSSETVTTSPSKPTSTTAPTPAEPSAACKEVFLQPGSVNLTAMVTECRTLAQVVAASNAAGAPMTLDEAEHEVSSTCAIVWDSAGDAPPICAEASN